MSTSSVHLRYSAHHMLLTSPAMPSWSLYLVRQHAFLFAHGMPVLLPVITSPYSTLRAQVAQQPGRSIVCSAPRPLLALLPALTPCRTSLLRPTTSRRRRSLAPCGCANLVALRFARPSRACGVASVPCRRVPVRTGGLRAVGRGERASGVGSPGRAAPERRLLRSAPRRASLIHRASLACIALRAAACSDREANRQCIL